MGRTTRRLLTSYRFVNYDPASVVTGQALHHHCYGVKLSDYLPITCTQGSLAASN